MALTFKRESADPEYRYPYDEDWEVIVSRNTVMILFSGSGVRVPADAIPALRLLLGTVEHYLDRRVRPEIDDAVKLATEQLTDPRLLATLDEETKSGVAKLIEQLPRTHMEHIIGRGGQVSVKES